MTIYAVGITVSQSIRSPTGFSWRNVDELAVTRTMNRSTWPEGPVPGAAVAGKESVSDEKRSEKGSVEYRENVEVAKA